MMYYELWKNSKGKWNFRICDSGNCKILAFSNQGYENRGDCVDTITQIHGSRPEGLDMRELP